MMNKMVIAMIACMCISFSISGLALQKSIQTDYYRDRIAALEARLDTEFSIDNFHCDETNPDPENQGTQRWKELGIEGKYAEFWLCNGGDWDVGIMGFYFGTSEENLTSQETNNGLPTNLRGYGMLHFYFNYNWTEGTIYYMRIETNRDYTYNWNTAYEQP